jgi:hypothetical protein
MKRKSRIGLLIIFMLLISIYSTISLALSNRKIISLDDTKISNNCIQGPIAVNILPNTIPVWIPDWRVFIEIKNDDHPRILHWRLKVYHGAKNWTIGEGSIPFNKPYDIIYVPYSFKSLPLRGYGFGSCYLRVKIWCVEEDLEAYDCDKAFAIGFFIRIPA